MDEKERCLWMAFAIQFQLDCCCLEHVGPKYVKLPNQKLKMEEDSAEHKILFMLGYQPQNLPITNS